jgi:hypothetical protein
MTVELSPARELVGVNHAAPARRPTYTLADVEVMARHAAASQMFAMNTAQAFTLMLIAQSEGLDPIQALRRFHVIHGRPSMRADAMLAEFQRQGGTVDWQATTHEECRAVFKHPVQCPRGQLVNFTMADAQRAGLANKDIWRAYPDSMLQARVISRGVRLVLPGVVVGIYTPEEVADFLPAEPHRRGPAGRSMPDHGAEDEPRPEPGRGNPWRPPPAPRPRPGPGPAPGPQPGPDPDAEPEPDPDGDPTPVEPDDQAGQAKLSALRKFIRREIEAANLAFRNELLKGGMALPDRISLCNEFQVGNALISQWVEEGLLIEAEVAGPDGKRDRERMAKVLTKAHEGQRAEVEDDVRDYVRGKLNKAYASYGITPAGDRDEAQAAADDDRDPAEDETS